MITKCIVERYKLRKNIFGRAWDIIFLLQLFYICHNEQYSKKKNRKRKEKKKKRLDGIIANVRNV